MVKRYRRTTVDVRSQKYLNLIKNFLGQKEDGSLESRCFFWWFLWFKSKEKPNELRAKASGEHILLLQLWWAKRTVWGRRCKFFCFFLKLGGSAVVVFSFRKLILLFVLRWFAFSTISSCFFCWGGLAIGG